MTENSLKKSLIPREDASTGRIQYKKEKPVIG